MYLFGYALEVGSFVIMVFIIVTILVVALATEKLKVLFLLFLEFIPIFTLIIGCYICNKHEYEYTKQEYNKHIENIRKAEAEMAKFLVLHPEFKEISDD